MTMPARLRWMGYAVAAAATGTAVWMVDGGDELEVVLPVVRAPAGAAARTPAPGAMPVQLAMPLARRLAAPTADPFAVAGTAATDAENTPRPAPASALAAVASVAPPMPFVFVGRWKEQGRSFVFLQRDERSYKVEQPGPLDADYAVQSIHDNRIELRYLPLGLVQELRFDAPAMAPAAVAARLQPGPAAPTDQPEN